MDMEDIEKKQTIEFPRAIGREDAEDLLKYIAKEIPANVSSTIKFNKSFIYNPKKEEIVERKGALEVSISINSLKGFKGHDTFVSNDCVNNSGSITSISATMMPSWTLIDYGPKRRELWKDVREVVDEYFELMNRKPYKWRSQA